jgi:hypothetical protein
MSASAYATFVKAAPHVGIRRSEATGVARLAEIRAANRAAAMPRLWGDMDGSMRMVLVMLACGQAGDVQRIIRQPWGSFSANDQEAMASASRLVIESLAAFAAIA